MEPTRTTRRQFLRRLAATGSGLAGASLLPWSAEAQAPAAGSIIMELLFFRQGTLPPPPVDERREGVPRATIGTGSLKLVPAGQLQLAGLANTLRRRGEYGLIGIGGWVMPVAANATGVLALDDVVPTQGQVNGSVGLQRGMYLTVQLDAVYAPRDGLQLVLAEKRRVKFDERHYLDHESFGAVVLVRKA